MKTLIRLSAAVLVAISCVACTTVVKEPATTSTTTTESSSVRSPVMGSTTETHSVRNY